ncbi:MAG TPA: hypothetical protein VE971_01365 [Candidatus Eisenbacteria bacterium]|nr:hypothetical protein [Candidatus Eisenbacteria bacterium]
MSRKCRLIASDNSSFIAGKEKIGFGLVVSSKTGAQEVYNHVYL